MWCSKVGIILVLFVVAPIRADALPLADEDDPFRLPRNSRPIRYDIALTTNVHTGETNFNGVVIIDIEITAESDTITLHNHGLIPTSTRLYDNGVEIIAIESSSDPSRDFFFITSTERVLRVGELYSIKISFSGQLQTSMNGFYISSYRIGSETRFLASTQFQATGARYAFFSYDEPEFKAEFKLAITHTTAYAAISNILSTRVDNGDDSTTTFETSPIMSTYLLAFVISDFGYSSNEVGLPVGETMQRVYARPDETARTEYALEHSIKFLKQLETWAKYSYELPKMFSAAIPDLAAGAMENWGLITYKEQYLIVEETSHQRERFDSLRVIAHMLGHQFFGNVVTCQWWNYIWLNEGFATVFEYLLVELEYPQLRMRDLFSVIKVQGAFGPDSLEASHPLTYDGQTQPLIIYDKAGSVIRMFQYAIGDELFRDAMSYYLDVNNHKPVTSDNFYAAVEVVLEESNFREFDFTAAFKTWENQKGYPLLQVTADDSSYQFRVTQQRYLALTDKIHEDDRRWYIPMNFATESNPDFNDITITNYFLDNQLEVTISYPRDFISNQWFIFNKQQIGYYRVNYDANNWQQLIRVLNSDRFEEIHVSNRAQLVDDALNLAADEYLDYEIAFSILSYLERETDYVPWRAAIANLDKLDYIIASQPTQSTNFQRFVRKLARLMYVRYRLEEKEGDTMMDQYARELAIDWTCRMGDERCLRDTYSYLNRVALGGLLVPKSLEITYMCNGLRGFGRHAEFTALWNRMLNSNDQSERIRIIDGLVCSSDTSSLRTLLQATFDNSQLTYKAHEITRIWSNILSRSLVGIDVLVDIIDEFYDEMRTLSGSLVSSTLISISQRVFRSSDQERLTALIDRLVERPIDPLSIETRTKALNNILINNNWVASEKYSQATAYVNRYIAAIDDEQNQLILPKTSEPRSYKIHITATDIPSGGRDFSGEIEINALVKETTDRIMIHSREQTVLDVQVYYKSGLTEIPVYDYSSFAATHTLTIYFIDEIPENSEIVMRIKYSGIMQTSATNHGFHITSYVHEGDMHYLGVTQFMSSLSSRSAFPHYDEPRYKATFDLTLTHSNLHHSISNTFGTAVNNVNGTVTTTFERTPTMSSYLLAFLISDLEFVTNADTKQDDETLHRVWVRPDSVSKAWFALQSSDIALRMLENYLGFLFDLPKMDLVGIPNKSGTMGNWGLITYWESAMIYEEHYEDISHASKLSGGVVIMHEETLQFFGNVVTFEWWDYLWLSIGFATLFEYQLTGVLYPDWRTRHFFNIRKLHNAFRYDSIDSTRSMTPTRSRLTPAEIRLLFDTIAYDKSGCVLRMFQNAVGEEIFRSSLNLYLTDNQYKSVVPQNLFDAFQTVMDSFSFTDFDFATAFRTWELQKGYPVIHCSYSDATRQFQITQERYFKLKPETLDDTSNWYIPMNFATQSDPSFDDTRITNYFSNGLPSISIAVPPSFDASEWFIFNKQQLGYYRVNYDASNWHSIILALKSGEYERIHVLNRVQLIDDAVNFAAGGYLSYDVLFNLLQYLSRETEYSPWYSADRYISQLYTTFGPFNNDLNLFIGRLSKRLYGNFKLEVDGIIPFEEVYERYGREIAIRIACNAGNEDCLKDSSNVLKQFLESDRPIPKGLETVIWCNSFKTASDLEWVEMLSKMQATSDITFRSQILGALGCSRNSVLLKNYLESTVSIEFTYTQTERRNVLSSVLNSSAGLQAVINFIRDFKDEILSSFSYTLEDALSVPARTIRTTRQQILFNNFLQTVTDLAEASATNINTIIENNFLEQQKSLYADVLAMVQEASENQLILPKTSLPRHYKLHLDARYIITGDRAFTGEIEIHVVITEVTYRIMMHSKNQVIDALQVFLSDGSTEVELIKYHLYPEADTLTIYFVDYVFPNDELIVHIKYSSYLVLSTTGFFQTSYVIDGEQRFLGVTQFESKGGRYAFPHYDEIIYKATFELTLTHSNLHHAISNTVGSAIDNGDGSVTTTFEQTPIMSSYILAFVISDLESVTNEDTKEDDETLHRIWVRPDSVSKAKFALQAADRALKALESYLEFKFELPKMDSAGIPGLAVDAAENWGLITYSEQYLIVEETSHQRERFDSLRAIAHEIGHQFFGNVVTWNYIWWNEGFAIFFEYLLVELEYPELRMRDLFSVIKMQGAFRPDSLEASPFQSSITFDKAGSILRMFQYAIGDELFRDAISYYLEVNNHKTVTPDDLYAAVEVKLEESSFREFDFTAAFKTWENQKGFPLIHVTADDSSNKFRVMQRRYLAVTDRIYEDDRRWYIPMNFATESNRNFNDITITDYFLDNQIEAIVEYPPAFTSSQWFIFNKQQIGYYRVTYDASNWQQLIRILNSERFEEIHVSNRAQLVDDALTLASDEHLHYEIAFSILSYLERETDYVPWRAAIINLDKLDYIIASQPAQYTNFQRFVRKLARLMYVRYGLEEREGDTMMDQYARELTIDWTCRMGDERCLRDTYSYLKRIAFEGLVVPKSLEITYMCNGLRGLGRQEEFTVLWNRMHNSNDLSERIRIIDSLVCSSDSTSLRTLLQSTFDNSQLTYREHEITRIWSNILSRSWVGINVLIDVIDEFYDEVSTLSSFLVSSTIISISERVTRSSDQERLTTLIDKLVERPTNSLSTATRTNALNNILVNNDWIASDKFMQATAFVNEVIAAIDDEQNQLTLPKTSEPRSYKIHIRATNIPSGGRDFSGEIEIDSLVKERTNRIMIHSREHTILDVQAFYKSGLTAIPVYDYSTFAAAHTLTIYFIDEIPRNSEILMRITYSGILHAAPNNYGFHITSYDHEGEMRYMGVRLPESLLRSRFAFPHYDEPRYKATFELTLTHSDRQHALSNTFGNAVNNGDGTITTTFEQTLIMSSYLLPFVILDVLDVESVTN